MQTVISTVGISLARNNKELINPLKGVPVSKIDTVKGQFQEAFQILKDYIENDQLDFQVASAELNVLSRLNILDMDHLVFLASDTLDSYLCGKVIAIACERKYRCQTDVKVIPGLQLNNTDKLHKEGIKNFIQIVNRYIKKANEEQRKIIFNAIGGFKITHTYFTLLGQLEGLPVCYIHEDYKELVYLPSAPLGFDTSQLKKLNKLIGENKIILLFKGVPHKELKQWTNRTITELKQQFNQILVWEREKVYLSVLAQIVYDRDVRPHLKSKDNDTIYEQGNRMEF